MPPAGPWTRHLTQPVLAEWIHELEDLTGRSYSQWPSRESDEYEQESRRWQTWLPEGGGSGEASPHSTEASRSRDRPTLIAGADNLHEEAPQLQGARGLG